MRIPTVDPVGVRHEPPDYVMRPRDYSASQRGLAAFLLASFTTVVIVTTVLSLGAYCLTSDGENTRGLAHRPPVTARR